MSLLVVEDLHKRYGKEEVLKGVSFTLEPGETKVIIGPSGTGKSTLLRCINRLTEPDRGHVWLNGEEITSPRVNIYRIRAQIGFVFQDFNLFTHLTALDNVRLGLIRVKRMPKREATERAMRELARVGLADKANAYPAQLSGGQQQRMFIARTLAQEAELILMDEPLSGLDLPSQRSILDILDRLRATGVTVMVATHDLNLAAERFDRMMLLHRKLIGIGSAPEVITPANLQAAYGGNLRLLEIPEGTMMVNDTCCGKGEKWPR